MKFSISNHFPHWVTFEKIWRCMQMHLDDASFGRFRFLQMSPGEESGSKYAVRSRPSTVHPSVWWNHYITYLLSSHWVTSNQAQDHCSSGARWVESNHADGSNDIGYHAIVFNAQVDGLVTGNGVDDISRPSDIHSCSWYQTMQFCIRNPMN